MRTKKDSRQNWVNYRRSRQHYKHMEYFCQRNPHSNSASLLYTTWPVPEKALYISPHSALYTFQFEAIYDWNLAREYPMSTDRATTAHGSPQSEICQEVAIPSSSLEMPDEVAGQPVSEN